MGVISRIDHQPTSPSAHITMVTATAFKGESFPAYVVSRAGGPALRLSSSNAVASSLIHSSPLTVAATIQPSGPSAHDLAMKSALVLSPTPSTMLLRATPLPIKTPTRPQRPSLSEQLKTISQGAQSITSQLRSSYQLGNALQQHSGGCGGPVWSPASDFLLEATTIHMSVGRLDCRFPGPVQFAADRCSYLFQHPFEAKEIQMVMYYRDMRQVHLSQHERSLKFRVQRVLEQFGGDYRPANPHHFLKLVFATPSEMQKVRQFLAKRKSEFSMIADNETFS